jgi:large subunit ribosomal protein L31
VKSDTHPTYYPEAKVTCSCGQTWPAGSTKSEIRVELCSNCHPFFTGEQRIVDTEGRVERLRRRYGLDKNKQN